jgi:hypothetical protein
MLIHEHGFHGHMDTNGANTPAAELTAADMRWLPVKLAFHI